MDAQPLDGPAGTTSGPTVSARSGTPPPPVQGLALDVNVNPAAAEFPGYVLNSALDSAAHVEPVPLQNSVQDP
jgi:hypothetical protein